MKMTCVAAAVSCGLFAGAASADFVSLVLRQKTDIPNLPDNLFVCNLYLKFDAPTDRFLSIGFANIATMDGSSFHQDPFGGDKAPPSFLVDVFPSLLYDSFLTIGYKVVPEGAVDGTSFDAGWNPNLFDVGGQVVGGWFNSNPPNGQGDAGNYEDGEILIAQLVTIDDGAGDVVGIAGSFTVFWAPDYTGEVQSAQVSFMHVPAPGAIALLVGGGFVKLKRRRRV